MRSALAVLGTASALAILTTVVLGSRAAAQHAFHWMVPASILGLAAWVALTPARGRVAGAGDLRTFARILYVEAITRVGLIAVAFAVRSHASALLALAVGLPLAVSAAYGLTFAQTAQDNRAATAARLEHVWFWGVSIGFQACLNVPSLMFEWKVGRSSPRAVGQFVTANSYFALPTVLMAGLATHTLVVLSRSWADGDESRFRTQRAVSLRRATQLAVAGAAITSVAGPLALHIYYGASIHLPLRILAAMALSSALSVVGAVAVQGLLAVGKAQVAAAAWLLGGVLTLIVFGMSHGTDRVGAAGLVAGPALALSVALAGLARLDEPDGRRRR